MQQSQILPRVMFRIVFGGALLGLALTPGAQAQSASTSGPSDPTMMAYSSSSSLPDDPGAPAAVQSSSGQQAPTLGAPTSTQPQTPTYGGGQQRRTYGRPTYSDRWTNADGSNKYSVEFGGGFDLPTGATKKYQNTGWNIKVGGGYNFSQRIGVMLDYDYAHFGIPSSVLNTVNPNGGGDTHLWSLTANPIFNYKTSGKLGGYLVAGGGFYRKLVAFNQPFNSQCAYYSYFGCIPGVVSQTVAHFSNNAFGLNFGTGVTYKFSEYSHFKVFAEARYTWVDNQQSKNSTSPSGYAPTNYRTEYIPVTFGVRW